MQMFQTLARTMPMHGLLYAGCGRCNHTRAFDYVGAARTFGPDAKPSEIRGRLVCSKCGERRRIRIWLVG